MGNEVTDQQMVETDQSGSPLPPEHSVGHVHKFVSFFVGETRYAIPAKDVAEVTGYLKPTPLPDSPPELLGIAPHRGDILGVIRFDSIDQVQPALNKAIVLRPTGQTEMPIAFNVERLGELVAIDTSGIYLSRSESPNAELEATVEGQPVLILEPARLVGSLTRI